MNNELELLCDIKNILGEGPYVKDGVISFIDILGKKLHIYDGNLKTIEFEKKISAAIPINNINGYLVFSSDTIYLYKDNKIEEYKKINDLVDDGMRPNDAKVDALGRVFFSTMVDDDRDASGALYSLYKNEIKFIQKTKLGNGIAFSKDNKKFFFSDSLEHKVYSYDYDLENGTLSNKEVLFEVDFGVPDGITIDNDDNLFVAIWGLSKIVVINTKNKEVLDEIKLPTKLITSATFTLDDELIITTASLEEKDEFAGRVFKLKTKYKGRKEYFFNL